MSNTTRVLVTGAGGQVGVDLVDTLAGQTPLGGDSTFVPDGRRIDADEFEVLALGHHDLDITDRDRVSATLHAAHQALRAHLEEVEANVRRP